jgi:hypothetical protein
MIFLLPHLERIIQHYLIINTCFLFCIFTVYKKRLENYFFYEYLDITPISSVSKALNVATSGGHPMMTAYKERRTENQQKPMIVQTTSRPEF